MVSWRECFFVKWDWWSGSTFGVGEDEYERSCSTDKVKKKKKNRERR